MAGNLKIPKGIRNDRKFNYINSKNLLILNDLHIPYHSEKSIEVVVKFALKNKVQTILFNGDIIDFYSISRFNKIPTTPNLQIELDTTFEVLSYFRKKFPKTKIFYTQGNHERRLLYYLCKNSELFSLNNLMLKNLLRLDELNIELVEDKQLSVFKGNIILHGDEINGGGGVNVARSVLMKTKENSIFGHFHKSQNYSDTTLSGKVINSYAVGCLCDLSPDYLPYTNNWNHGFCFIDDNGIVHNKKIVEKTVISTIN